ncbi:YkgJ family cysteine cluster protein [Rhizobium hidalgonense]|uniref:YkgJ family cysteine cluster protein n=1 Tax=Rhizobium hidalgonense TaxID=1538159 RepID=UPI00027CDDCF|nr:YkgJ family cysteine cluster protein [Rhizobium hidalgonense]EJC75263.1 putative Fe-S oxidoreductase [Rhizobium leguminosarum bv. trifolii WSM2012]EJC76454.1 putative Fe-S oxidoreductase [Rhizobium leguminosarum bv. trifolii WSM2012]MDR9805573.1 YkgJ family cysteine cluster protein [Rhizobium hidalgonense]RWX07132.1 YkgJ family cysteine cluster protein [Rhizobium hidalgonense]
MTFAIDVDCEACGACCSFSPTWPRFSTETEAEIDALPARFVSDDQRGMRCHGARCSALAGRVGSSTSCLVYDLRPDVCRACVPGDGACLEARSSFGLD